MIAVCAKSEMYRATFTLRQALRKTGSFPFVYSKEVLEALKLKRPVVALESTIISHGMPYPQNFDTAREVEACIRDTGAVPATIAILDGRVNIGLEEEKLKMLAVAGQSVVKAARRDLSRVCSRGEHGATTVSATMLLAHRAGIDIFVTGGIGGVHRGAEKSNVFTPIC